MGRANKIIYVLYTPGLAKDVGNALISYFGFKSKKRKGKKGPKFPGKKAQKTCKELRTVIPIKMAAN